MAAAGRRAEGEYPEAGEGQRRGPILNQTLDSSTGDAVLAET